MDLKKTIAITLAGVVSLAGVGTTDIGEKIIKCTGKSIQYEMTVTDGEKNEQVYVCETEEGYVTKKIQLIQNITENTAKAKTGVSPSVEALLIAYNDPKFSDDVSKEILKKYDIESHAFKGDDMGTDLIEQRQLMFRLAYKKCGGKCVLEGDTINEQVYNLLTK